MTCDEFESSRAKGGSPDSRTVAPSALEHLRGCAQCRAVHAIRMLPAEAPEVPAALQARIVEDLTGRLRPVSPLPSNRAQATLLLSLAVLTCAAGTWWQGYAGWLKLARWQAAIIFCLLGAAMTLTAMVISREMVPGARRWTPLAAAAALICALLFTAVLLMFPYQPNPDSVSIGLHCWEIGVECSAAAGALFFLVVRRGAWLSPLALGASTGLFAGLAGLTVLEILCPYLDRGHIGVWHFGAASTATLTGAGIAAIGSELDRLRPRTVS